MAESNCKELIAKMDEDLRYLLDQRKVDISVQASLVEAGLTSVSFLAWLGDDAKEVRSAIAAPPISLDPEAVGLEPGEKLKKKVSQAKLLDAWDAARCRGQERHKQEAAQRASNLPLSLPQGDIVSMRAGHEKIFGRTADDAFPAAGVLERRLQEIEQGNLTAGSLQDVPSASEVSADAEGIALDCNGNFRTKRVTQKVALPSDSEELRRRVRLLGVTFSVAKTLHPNRAWLASASTEVWLDHLDYILGPRVWGLNLGGDDLKLKPSWKVILEYELAIRQEAMRLIVHEGKDLKDALMAARKCSELKDIHFMTPALVHTIRDANSSSYGAPPRGRQGGRSNDGPYEQWKDGGSRKSEAKSKGKNGG